MTQQDFDNLTPKEQEYLRLIFNSYSEEDNICYNEALTPTEKGVFGSLVKKGLIYDSFEGMHHEQGYEMANFFPSGDVIDLFGGFKI